MKVKTVEGFEIKNVTHFPSMEYGENGGTRADVIYKGAYVGTVTDYGNGGMAIIDYDRSLTKRQRLDVDTACLNLAKRTEEAYSQYDFLKKKTAKDVDGDDYICLVTYIDYKQDVYDHVSKVIKQHNCPSVLVAESVLKIAYLANMHNNPIEDLKKCKTFPKWATNCYLVTKEDLKTATI